MSSVVAVTGAEGFIGSTLVSLLQHAGADVRAFVHYKPYAERGNLAGVDVETYAGDVRDAGRVADAVDGCEVVFHLAALIGIPYSYQAPESYVATNVTGTHNIVNACRRHNARLVHTSTSEVYGSARTVPISETHPLQPQSPYSASKIGADMMALSYWHAFQTPVSIVRPFNTYGPRQSERAVIPTIVRQALDPACAAIKLGDLTTTRDFNYVTDTVAAFLAIGRAAEIEFGAPYNTGTGHAVSVADVLERVRELTGTNKPVESEAHRVRPERSEVRTLLADPARLTAATGWRAEVALDEGLGHVVAWWRDRLAGGTVRRSADYAT